MNDDIGAGGMTDSGLDLPAATASTGSPGTVSSGTESSAKPSGIVGARGTGEGLVIRLDGRVEPVALKDALREYVGSRKSFLQGTSVSLEWVGAKPENQVVEDILSLLAKDFEIEVRINRLRAVEAVAEKSKEPLAARVAKEVVNDSKSVSLFDGIEALGLSHELGHSPSSDVNYGYGTGIGAGLGLTTDASGAMWDDADARIVYSTLRSGQRVETEHSLVIIGDVNSGAEVVAGGDIIVLGNLRGVAHAGAYDETGGGRVIVALTMAPTQLRIGSVISRGGAAGQKGTEVARVDGSVITVELYQARNLRGHLFKGGSKN